MPCLGGSSRAVSSGGPRRVASDVSTAPGRRGPRSRRRWTRWSARRSCRLHRGGYQLESPPPESSGRRPPPRLDLRGRTDHLVPRRRYARHRPRRSVQGARPAELREQGRPLAETAPSPTCSSAAREEIASGVRDGAPLPVPAPRGAVGARRGRTAVVETSIAGEARRMRADRAWDAGGRERAMTLFDGSNAGGRRLPRRTWPTPWRRSGDRSTRLVRPRRHTAALLDGRG